MKEGWTYKKLGDVCDIFNGNSINADFKKKHFLGASKGLPFIATKDVSSNGTIDYKNGVRIPNYSEYKIAPANSVFVCAEGGSAGKKFAYVEQNVCFGNKLFCIKPKSGSLEGKFVYHFVQSDLFKKQFYAFLTGLIGGVSAKKFQQIEIPILPLSEQQRIVSRLDSAFAHIDELKANAEKQLSEARALFQKALAKAMEPKDGWEEKTLKDLSKIVGDYGLNVSSKPYNGVRYLRITDITDWGDLNDEKVSANDSEKTQIPLKEGDILFARTGATVGKTLVFRKEFGECLFAGYLIRYRVNTDIILPRFLHYITHSNEYFDWVSLNQEAAAQPNISAKKYNMLQIHYPSVDEQHRIVARLDSLSENVRKYEDIQKKVIAECDNLKQALLRKVFE
jgi:type I restriction enzyme S subunit